MCFYHPFYLCIHERLYSWVCWYWKNKASKDCPIYENEFDQPYLYEFLYLSALEYKKTSTEGSRFFVHGFICSSIVFYFFFPCRDTFSLLRKWVLYLYILPTSVLRIRIPFSSVLLKGWMWTIHLLNHVIRICCRLCSNQLIRLSSRLLSLGMVLHRFFISVFFRP